jgi:hypothetical protein
VIREVRTRLTRHVRALQHLGHEPQVGGCAVHAVHERVLRPCGQHALGRLRRDTIVAGCGQALLPPSPQNGTRPPPHPAPRQCTTQSPGPAVPTPRANLQSEQRLPCGSQRPTCTDIHPSFGFKHVVVEPKQTKKQPNKNTASFRKGESGAVGISHNAEPQCSLALTIAHHGAPGRPGAGLAALQEHRGTQREPTVANVMRVSCSSPACLSATHLAAHSAPPSAALRLCGGAA